MSFLFKNTHTNKKINKRKEYDSFLAHHPKQISHNSLERASSFISKGSITLEASLAAPIFLAAVLCLVYLLEMISVQTMMKSALHAVGKTMAEETYISPIFSTDKMEREIVKHIGKNRLDNSIVSGGSSGIDCSRSKIFRNTSVMELSLRYKLKIPVLKFRILMISREEILRVKGWSGDEGNGFGSYRDEMVYITETGVVYHQDKDCTYLELSIHMVRKKEIPHLRNLDGGKYKPCERCGWKSKKNVYITDSGDRYHSSVSCSGLKRKIYAVPLSDVYGRGGCSRCVK